MANHRDNRQPPEKGNLVKLEQLKEILDRLTARVLRQGFFGNAAVKLTIQDGTIQHITSKIKEDQR